MTALRFGSAISAFALAAALGGCAGSQSGLGKASIFGGKVDTSNIGLATKALVALNAKDPATAIKFAERAVANSPKDAGFRSLLGNAYFAGGRFASAEAAYRDSLTLISNQPSVVLKLALTQVAQGKNAEAVSLLNAAQGVLDVADRGLALALAGQPQLAVATLEPAARDAGADARLRQNLALAYALSGNWEQARVVAAQDLSADLVDARVRDWMSLANPARASDQVAALTGVVPAAVDPGQPVRLALAGGNTRMAEAAPTAVAPVAVAEAAPAPVAVVEAAPVPAAPLPAPEVYYAGAEAAPVPVEVAAVLPAADPAPAFVTTEAEPAPKPVAVAVPAAIKVAKLVRKQNAALPVRKGNSGAVVQLGAYGSPERVTAAWSSASRKFAVLRAYAPMSARFNGPNGTVHRLSVQGFSNVREAVNLCSSLRRAGGNCFVRSVAGDAPVQLAAR